MVLCTCICILKHCQLDSCPTKEFYQTLNGSVLHEDVRILRAICSKWLRAKQTAVQLVIDVLADIPYFCARFLQQILQQTGISTRVNKARVIDTCWESAPSQPWISLDSHSPLKSTLGELRQLFHT